MNIEQVIKATKRLPWIWRAFRSTDQWFPLLLCYGGLRQPTFPYTVRFRNGFQLTLRDRLETVVLWHISFGCCYRVSPADRVILDVGGNIGMFCLWAAGQAKAAAITSVEPFPETFERLRAHIRDNRLEHRVTLVNAAVANDEGTRLMESNDRSSVNKFIMSAGSTRPGVPVKCVRLASVFPPPGPTRVDLLKIDVEGSEFEILLSAEPDLLGRCDRIDVEVHLPGAEGRQRREQLVRHLAAAGHRLVATDLDKQDCGLMHFSRPGPG
jgi:FkbM family methyltransferase